MLTLKKVATLLGLTLVAVISYLIINSGSDQKSITVISDRSDFHLEPIFDSFYELTGIEINPVFVDQGTLPVRFSSNADRADVVVTTDISYLAQANNEGLIADLQHSDYKGVPDSFVMGGGRYVATSYRGRAIVYNTSVIDPNSLSGYEDLASEEFRGRVCIRPFTHVYNITLASEMIADKGLEWTKNWVDSVKNNLAVEPNGNDRNQAKLVSEGVCDIALMNTYYYGLLQTNNDQRGIAANTQIFFPNQSSDGTYAIFSGAAIAERSDQKDDAQLFIDYLLGRVGQKFISDTTFEYPVNSNVDISVIAKSFGEGQNGIEEGQAIFNFVDVEEIMSHRDEAAEMMAVAGS